MSRRRPSRSRLPPRTALTLRLALALGAALSAPALPLAAQPPARDPIHDPLELRPPQESILLHRTVSAFPPPDGLLRVGAGLDLFTVELLQTRGRELVEHRDLFLEAEYSPLPLLHAVARLPFRSWTGGTGPFPPSGSGLGDLEALFAVALPRPVRAVALTAAAGATLPTGDRAAGLSEGEVSPRALLAAGLRVWPEGPLPTLTLHLNAGRRWNAAAAGHGRLDGDLYRPWPPLYPAAPGPSEDNDALLLGGALELSRGTAQLYLEYEEQRLTAADDVSEREFPRWLTAGLTWGRREGPAVRLAYAVSLTRDDPATPFLPLLPDLVTSLSLSWQFGAGGRDRDGDGVPDRRDRCPGLPEDRDGFEDEDGCPDPDNDGDGIPDALDECPDEPEDFDGFEDEDGCPEPDNDGDGIPDARDACPDLAEDFDGVEDGDGCPEELLDGDGDGIPDRDDACPGRAEDFDGFEDEDGCPEADNDLDGVPDDRDACPDEPEDYDGDRDDDGCPD